MNLQKIVDAQNQLVMEFANSTRTDWKRIFASLEIAEKETGYTVDYLTFEIYQNKQGQFDKEQIRSSKKLDELIGNLHKVYFEVHGKKWHSVEITIEPSGKYDMKFSYDEPKRINGTLDHDSYYRFSTYLEDHGFTPVAPKK